MAKPQLEDGYTRVANELFDAILVFPFSKRELLIVLAVARKTYGYNRKTEDLSNWYLGKITGMDRAHASRTVSGLIKKQVLTDAKTASVNHGQNVRRLGVNKDYSQWLTDANSASVKPMPKQHRCQNSTDANSASVTDAKTAQVTDAVLAPSKDSKDNKDNKKKKYIKKKIEIPDWLPEKLWLEFRAHRVALKSKMTPLAERRLFTKLDDMRARGVNIHDAIGQSIENGWKGIFEPRRENRTGVEQPSRSGQFFDRLKAIAGESNG